MSINESEKPMVYQIAEFLGRSPEWVSQFLGYELPETQNESKELKEGVQK